ncbi:ATPase, partial [Staphylococcus sp. SIMBA_130]
FAFDHLPIEIYLGLGLLALILGGVMYYKLRTNFKDLETTGSKGTSRFTTLKELQAQYRTIPEKKKLFSGVGGVPISRYKDKIFIDDSPVNNLWIGTTRSGKGEMGIFPMIDIYSRAEKKASMVLNDPKGELFASSKETLEKRGYHVEVLNL